jgi:hypothetical protein
MSNGVVRNPYARHFAAVLGINRLDALRGTKTIWNPHYSWFILKRGRFGHLPQFERNNDPFIAFKIFNQGCWITLGRP